MSIFTKTYIKGGNWYVTDNPKGSDLNLDKIISEVTGGGGGSSYKVYTALLSQTGTDPVVPLILENTIGDIVWTGGSGGNVGVFYGTLANAFTLGKCVCFVTLANYNGTALGTINLSAGVSDNDVANLYTYSWDGTATNPDTQGSYEISIEIRVYP